MWSAHKIFHRTVFSRILALVLLRGFADPLGIKISYSSARVYKYIKNFHLQTFIFFIKCKNHCSKGNQDVTVSEFLRNNLGEKFGEYLKVN